MSDIIFLALKGRHIPAQGNALGLCCMCLVLSLKGRHIKKHIVTSAALTGLIKNIYNITPRGWYVAALSGLKTPELNKETSAPTFNANII